MRSTHNNYYKNLPVNDHDNEILIELNKVLLSIIELEKSLNITPAEQTGNNPESLLHHHAQRIKAINNKLNQNKPERINAPQKPYEPQTEYQNSRVADGYMDNDYNAPLVYETVPNANYDKEKKEYDETKLPKYYKDYKEYEESERKFIEWNKQTYTHQGKDINRAQLLEITSNASNELERINHNIRPLNTYDHILSELQKTLNKTESRRTKNIQSIQNKIQTEIKDTDTDPVKIQKIAQILLQEYKAILNSFGGKNSDLGIDINIFLKRMLYITLPNEPEKILKFNLEVPTALELSLNTNANQQLSQFYAITHQYKNYSDNLKTPIGIKIMNDFAKSVLEITQNVNLWNQYNPATMFSSIPSGVADIKKILDANTKHPDKALKEIQIIAKEKLSSEKDSRTGKTTEFYQAIASLDIGKLQKFSSTANLDLPINKIDLPSNITNKTL